MAAARVPAGVPRDTTGFRSSGQSPGLVPLGLRPTVHVLGTNDVARAVLATIAAESVTVVAVSDDGATVFDRRGVPAGSLLRHVGDGGSLAVWPRAERLAPRNAVPLVAADVVVDTTEGEVEVAAAALARGVLWIARSPRSLAALLARGNGAAPSRLGIDAALGGLGGALAAEHTQLRERCRAFALVADAVDDDVLALRLVAIARFLFGTSSDVSAVAIGRAAANGTRRIARAARDGSLRIDHELVAVGSPLAAPADRTVVVYELDGSLRVHTGTAVGDERIAAALVADVRRAIATVAEVRI